MALQSYAHGSGDTPLLGVTVGQLLDTAARRWPDHDALIVVDQGVRWNRREQRERARDFAAGLLALGPEPGDRIGMLAGSASCDTRSLRTGIMPGAPCPIPDLARRSLHG